MFGEITWRIVDERERVSAFAHWNGLHFSALSFYWRCTFYDFYGISFWYNFLLADFTLLRWHQNSNKRKVSGSWVYSFCIGYIIIISFQRERMSKDMLLCCFAVKFITIFLFCLARFALSCCRAFKVFCWKRKFEILFLWPHNIFKWQLN